MRYSAAALLKYAWSVVIFVVMVSHAEGRTWYVNNGHPQATDGGAGVQEVPFKTISRGAQAAQPGDTVLIAGGIYRELVQPAFGGTAGRPIVYQAAVGQKVIIRGSDIFSPQWQVLHTDRGTPIYAGRLDPKIFRNYRMPWSKEFWYTESPFHTKPMVSAPESKIEVLTRTQTQRARPIRPDHGNKYTFYDAHRKPVDFASANPDLPLTLGQVFVDGAPVQQVVSFADLDRVQGSFLVSPDGGQILLHLPGESSPEQHQIEITTRAQVFAPRQRALQYIEVRGFVIEHAANQGPFPQAGMFSLRSGSHWIVENNIIRWASTIGLDCGGEGYPLPALKLNPQGEGNFCATDNVIRNNLVSDNGLCGLCGFQTRNLRIEGNIIERNNRNGLLLKESLVGNAEWWEQGGIKLHQCPGAIVQGNLVRDNDCFGIWLDTGWASSRITRNLLLNNMHAGIFLECGEGPVLIDNNVVAYTRSGHGYYSHDASGQTVAHNLFYRNANLGVWMWTVSERRMEGALVETSHNRILNNLILGNGSGAIGLPVDAPRNRDNLSDYNVINGGEQYYDDMDPLFFVHAKQDQGKYAEIVKREQSKQIVKITGVSWFMKLDAWRELTGWEPHSSVLRLDQQSLPFLRPLLANYEFFAPDKLLAASTIPIKGIDKDYFGKPIDGASKILPGPFQNLKAGRNMLYLWPIMNGEVGPPCRIGHEPAPVKQ